MPRYYFNVIDGKNIADRDGLELPDIGAARKTALRYAGELLRDESGDHIWAGHEWRMLVIDDAGQQVLLLRFSGEG